MYCNVQQQFHDYSSWISFRTLPSLTCLTFYTYSGQRDASKKVYFQFFVMFIHYSARFHRLSDLCGKLTYRQIKRTHTVQNKRLWYQLASRTRSNTRPKQRSRPLSSHSFNTQRTHYKTRTLITSYSKESIKLFSQFRRNTIRVSCIVTFE